MAARTGKQEGGSPRHQSPGKPPSVRMLSFVSRRKGTPLGYMLEGTVPRSAFCRPPVPFQQRTAPCIPDKEICLTLCSTDDSIVVRL